jgi:hypothetical protein
MSDGGSNAGRSGGASGIALLAIQLASYSGSTPCLRDDPGTISPRRIMAGMLVMAAIQLGNPVIFLILVKASDAAFHLPASYCVAAFSSPRVE